MEPLLVNQCCLFEKHNRDSLACELRVWLQERSNQHCDSAVVDNFQHAANTVLNVIFAKFIMFQEKWQLPCLKGKMIFLTCVCPFCNASPCSCLMQWSSYCPSWSLKEQKRGNRCLEISAWGTGQCLENLAECVSSSASAQNQLVPVVVLCCPLAPGRHNSSGLLCTVRWWQCTTSLLCCPCLIHFQICCQ